MNVSSVSTPKVATPGPKTFSYNSQDSDTLPTDQVTLPGVTAEAGRVSTDTVALTPQKAVMFLGQMISMKPDPNYKLNPNADGNFIFPKGSPSLNGSNSFAAVALTVNKMNEVRESMGYPSLKWAFGEQKLGVSPETGETPNAFYARDLKGTFFFHYKTTSTADSGEAVSHETGHAMLDAMRPGFLQGTGAETGAFHESFGDVMGMLMTLQNDEAVDKLVADTGGDLSKKANLLSDTGEGFGKALGMKGALRTAFNSLVYADPATLPSQGDDTHLGHEVHDLSRLWSGTFYDVLTGINAANMAAGMDAKTSLKSAGEEAFRLVVGQIEHSNNGSETTFKEMGQNLLASDQEHNGGKRADIIKNVLVKRGLMDANAPVASFAPAQRAFTGETTQQRLSFGPEMGILNGVKMDVTVPQASSFGLLAGGGGIDVAAEATKGASLLAQDGKILFTDHVPTLGEIFQPDGSAITAYVMPNANGERELHRVPLA